MPAAPIPLPSCFIRYLYIRGARNQQAIHILLGASIVTGALAVYAPLGRWRPLTGLLSLALVFAAAAFLGKAEQLAIDRSNNRFRHFVAFFSIDLGSWRPLPAVSRVVVKRFSEYTIAGRRGWQVNTPQKSHIVLLSAPTPNRSIVVGKFSGDREGEALLFAGELAAYLAVETYVFEQ